MKKQGLRHTINVLLAHIFEELGPVRTGVRYQRSAESSILFLDTLRLPLRKMYHVSWLVLVMLLVFLHRTSHLSQSSFDRASNQSVFLLSPQEKVWVHHEGFKNLCHFLQKHNRHADERHHVTVLQFRHITYFGRMFFCSVLMAIHAITESLALTPRTTLWNAS